MSPPTLTFDALDETSSPRPLPPPQLLSLLNFSPSLSSPRGHRRRSMRPLFSSSRTARGRTRRRWGAVGPERLEQPPLDGRLGAQQPLVDASLDRGGRRGPRCRCLLLSFFVFVRKKREGENA